MKVSTLLLPVAGLIALGFYAQKKAAGFLSYFIKSVSISWDGIIPVLKVNIDIKNPSNEQFTIRSISGTVAANGNAVGDFSSFQVVPINPNTQTTIPVFVRLAPLAVVSDLITLVLRGSGNSITLSLKGVVNANSVVTDLDMTFKVI